MRNEMQAPVASFQGGLLTSQGEFRKRALGQFRRPVGSVPRNWEWRRWSWWAISPASSTQTDFERHGFRSAQAAERAAEHGRADRAGVSRPGVVGQQSANRRGAGRRGRHRRSLGMCFDVFHYYIGPSKLEDLGYLTAENLFHVQLSDLAQLPRELASDADRILPGDGDFLLAPIVEHLRRDRLRGPVAVELMNPHIWQIPARQFGEIAMTALRKVLGLASMTMSTIGRRKRS